MEVQVRVRPRKGLAPLAVMDTQLPKQRRYLTRNEFEAVHGADPKDLRKVGAFAKQHGLVVVESSASRRTVVLAGTVGTFSKAFKVKLEHYQHSRGTYRGRKGPVHVPSGLAEVVEGVFGLDNRPFAEPHIARAPRAKARAGGGKPTFTPVDLAKIYDLPNGVDGTGQCS